MVIDEDAGSRTFDRFFALSFDMLIIASFDGDVLRVNPALERTLGHAAADVLGHSITEFVHPDDLVTAIEAVTRVVRAQPVEEIEVRCRCADGSYRWVAWSAQPDPETRMFYAVGRDVTERQRHAANLAFLAGVQDDLVRRSSSADILHAAGARLRAHADITAIFLTKIDEARDEARIEAFWVAGEAPLIPSILSTSQYVSPRFGELAHAGKTCVVRDIRTEPFGNADRYASLGIRSFVTVPFVKDGERTFQLTFGDHRPRDWREDDIELLEELANRLLPRLERTRAEEALRESEERYRTLFETIDEGYVTGEAIRDERGAVLDYRILEINPAFAKLNGRPAADIVGKTVREIAPDVDAIWLEVIDRVITERQPIRLEHIVERSGNWYDCYFAPAGESEPQRFVAVFSNITVRKRAEEERERARQQAENAVRARDEFLSIASHELRNPIAAIKATAQLMRRLFDHGTLDEGRLDKYTRTITETSDRLALLVDDLLDVSRLQAGQLSIHPVPVDLAALVKHAVEIEGIASAGHRLRFQVEEGRQMQVDAERVEQVIVNLLDNAIKYSPDGREVRILLSYDGGDAWLCVQDQGIGLPAGALQTIFEPFGRGANAASSQIQGMGLGLYIARRIVEAHGGKLWAESEGEGKGTTMCLWLPGQDRETSETATPRAGGG